jgi:hypothetical protein
VFRDCLETPVSAQVVDEAGHVDRTIAKEGEWVSVRMGMSSGGERCQGHVRSGRFHKVEDWRPLLRHESWKQGWEKTRRLVWDREEEKGVLEGRKVVSDV